MRSFFDTNVVVYLFDDDAPEKKAKAQALLEEEVSEGRAVLSTQVLQEFYVATTTKSCPHPCRRTSRSRRWGTWPSSH